MQLVIAEKPSVARDLARVLGAAQKCEGRLEGNGYVVTWCVGHLVELEEPMAYDARWKAWRLDTLPMLPSEFKLRPSKSGGDQLRVVAALLRERRFDSVVNACDAGREGELIFRYVVRYAGGAPPTKRLWISSLTDEAIRRGFAELKPASQFDALGDAARARSEADWLVGMNATRAITLRNRAQGGDTLLSIGRVQTPTLAMLVGREQAIRAFVPSAYWEVRATLATASGERFPATFSYVRATRLATAKLAETIVARATEHRHAADADGPRVENVRAKIVREAPPLLFDLTSLQRTGNRRFGWSAQHTLDLAQSLYERHKLLTYPRTDSRHLTTDVARELPKLFASLAEVPDYAPFAAPLIAHPPRPNRRVVDDGKVQDHHAIIPTGKRGRLATLDRDEARLFDLVARRFLGVFHPDAEFAVTEAVIRVGPEVGAPPTEPSSRSEPRETGRSPKSEDRSGEGRADGELLAALPPPPDRFLARGRVRLVAGWQEVAGMDGGDEERARGDGDEAATILPPLVFGQALDGSFEPLAKKTQPPRRFTEAALLSAMESAGKQLDDEALRAAMKDTGLGTPATRAAIIETLLKRSYIVREKKLLVPTATGMALIEALPVGSLASPELTGTWEARLAEVARGGESRAKFMADIGDYVRETVAAIRASEPPRASALAPVVVGRCPRCGGAVSERREAFGCGSCEFSMRKRVAGRAIGAPLAAVLLSRRKSQILPGFRSKAGKRFKASLLLEDDGALRFDFARRQSAATDPHGDADDGRSPASAPGGDPGGAAPAGKPSRKPRGKAAAILVANLLCPRCKVGYLVAGKRGWGCGRWRLGCSFVVWFETAGRQLTEAQLRDLVERGKTRKARWRDGAKEVSGRLVLAVDAAGGAKLETES